MRKSTAIKAKTEVGENGARITKLECGCEIIQTKPDILDALLGHIPEPIWFRCRHHKKTSPEDIKIKIDA